MGETNTLTPQAETQHVSDLGNDNESPSLLKGFPEPAVGDSSGNLISNPELVEEQGHLTLAKTVETMSRFHAEEIFATPEASKVFLDSLDFTDFKRWLNFVNGSERGVERSERGIRGGSDIEQESGLLGASIAYRAPYQKMRERLLEIAFTKAQQVNDPEVAGLTLGFAINAIHPYPDGNGRTARMVYALLSKGYSGSEGDNKFYTDLLENVAGREVVNPNPATHKLDIVIAHDLRKSVAHTTEYDDNTEPRGIYGGYGGYLIDDQAPETLLLNADFDISDVARNNLYLSMDDGEFAVTTFIKALGKDRLAPYTITNGNGTPVINADELLPTLTEKEITSIAVASVQIKGSYVNRLIHFSDRQDAAAIVEQYRF